ncbi:MAG TPA: tRNA (guanosine(37)-N1)-methyltransferase TrmD [Syntrophomonadaceae bacterium]|nr:tRNA (guanosine(37)-N1)-methyltransferase TrmD [Syntrophomonadaceae bacterium]
MIVDILTLFPEMFDSPFDNSIIKRARAKELVDLNTVNIRDYAIDKHRQVDDSPYGGGCGMVMKADVLSRAIQSLKKENTWTIYMSPQGKPLVQEKVVELSEKPHLVLLCGHYEGIDNRTMDLIDEEVSIGDYILTGGEIPALVLVDALVRLIPGVLGDDRSVEEESFDSSLLEYPHYTRPQTYEDKSVPEILLSGHHENIRLWRKKQSLLNTFLKRPDLLINREYTQEEKKLLMEIIFDRE